MTIGPFQTITTVELDDDNQCTEHTEETDPHPPAVDPHDTENTADALVDADSTLDGCDENAGDASVDGDDTGSLDAQPNLPKNPEPIHPVVQQARADDDAPGCSGIGAQSGHSSQSSRQSLKWVCISR